MKNTLLLTVATFLVAQTSQADEKTLFSSDFAPTDDFPHETWDVAAPQWLLEDDPQAATRRWVSQDQDPSSIAAVNSNGYFGELFREPGNDDNAWWMSERISAGGGMGYTLTFDFKATTDDGFANDGELEGEARMHVRYWQDQWWHLGEDVQPLILDGNVIGNGDVPTSEDFAEVTVGAADANGWKTVTLTGTTHENTTSLDIWAKGMNNEEDRFFGSFGIDNVELILDEAPFQTTWESNTHPAIELEFVAEIDKRYLLLSTSDLMEWTATEPLIIGEGEPVNRFISSRNADRMFLRVVTE